MILWVSLIASGFLSTQSFQKPLVTTNPELTGRPWTCDTPAPVSWEAEITGPFHQSWLVFSLYRWRRQGTGSQHPWGSSPHTPPPCTHISVLSLWIMSLRTNRTVRALEHGQRSPCPWDVHVWKREEPYSLSGGSWQLWLLPENRTLAGSLLLL